MLDMTATTAPQDGPRHYVDDAEIPKWGKADDGASVKLAADADFQVAFAEWQAAACRHMGQFTGKTVNGGGVAVYKRYCRRCGIATTQSLPHRSVENTTVTLIDNVRREALVDAYIAGRRDELDAIANAAANRQQPARRSAYADYLASSEWAERRALVMRRCGGVCEGCRKAGADDVHHLTYQHIGAEFLFELVGLCRGCHDRWHERA